MPSRYEFRFLTKDRKELWLDFAVSTIFYESLPGSTCYALDMTNQKKMEQQIRQTQKWRVLVCWQAVLPMISIIFSNIISGYASLIERHISSPEDLKKDSKTIQETTARGAALFDSLLIFSGNRK